MHKKDWYYIGIGIGSILLYFCLFYFFICRPYSIEIAQLQSISQKNKQQIDLLQQFAAQHNDLNKYVKNIEQKNLFWQKLLPPQENTAQFITALQQFADKNNIILLKIKPSTSNLTSEKKLPYNSKILTLQIQSDYFQLLNFLYNINVLPYYCTIEKFSTKKSSALLITDISIKYYSLSDNKKIIK